jgi:hypothetical protein
MFDKHKAAIIAILESKGILRELQPIHDGYGGSIWHYKVLKPEKLPEQFKAEYEKYREISN